MDLKLYRGIIHLGLLKQLKSSFTHFKFFRKTSKCNQKTDKYNRKIKIS